MLEVSTGAHKWLCVCRLQPSEGEQVPQKAIQALWPTEGRCCMSEGVVWLPVLVRPRRRTRKACIPRALCMCNSSTGPVENQISSGSGILLPPHSCLTKQEGTVPPGWAVCLWWHDGPSRPLEGEGLALREGASSSISSKAGCAPYLGWGRS